MELLHVAFILSAIPIMIDSFEFLTQLAPPYVEPGIVCSGHGPGSCPFSERKGSVSTYEDLLLRLRRSFAGERRDGCDAEETLLKG
ncbi:MAG: hypothetical protein A3G81_22790 [Betaproteobacteria bacterium RIFCSPLOWO2_12_FULL_65_14]|nr:MAG: hypothetical protein A3G81_22790 [Betaproteobacteria bacterium RIFCSPLOWO2_12_FULL_65_14]